jgi:hypothetical protein
LNKRTSNLQPGFLRTKTAHFEVESGTSSAQFQNTSHDLFCRSVHILFTKKTRLPLRLLTSHFLLRPEATIATRAIWPDRASRRRDMILTIIRKMTISPAWGAGDGSNDRMCLQSVERSPDQGCNRGWSGNAL